MWKPTACRIEVGWIGRHEALAGKAQPDYKNKGQQDEDRH
jgi:hypothetical protein